MLDALGAMARAGALDDDIRDQLATVPAERLSGYASIRGLVTIADCLSPPQRDEALTAAWAMACQLLSFEGRPEAQAAVAAKFHFDTGRDQVEQALTTIIDQIRNIEVRLLHPWSAAAGSDHARERVRCCAFPMSLHPCANLRRCLTDTARSSRSGLTSGSLTRRNSPSSPSFLGLRNLDSKPKPGRSRAPLATYGRLR